MQTQVISLKVDEDTAQAYSTAPDEDRSKLSLLVNIWLRSLTERSPSLNSVMDDLSEKAKERGMTPALLEEMLNDR